MDDRELTKVIPIHICSETSKVSRADLETLKETLEAALSQDTTQQAAVVSLREAEAIQGHMGSTTIPTVVEVLTLVFAGIGVITPLLLANLSHTKIKISRGDVEVEISCTYASVAGMKKKAKQITTTIFEVVDAYEEKIDNKKLDDNLDDLEIEPVILTLQG